VLATFVAAVIENNNRKGLLSEYEASVERLYALLQHLAREIRRPLACVHVLFTSLREDCRLSGYGCVMHVLKLHVDADGAGHRLENEARPEIGAVIGCRAL
jgi:hypothetical protein